MGFHSSDGSRSDSRHAPEPGLDETQSGCRRGRVMSGRDPEWVQPCHGHSLNRLSEERYSYRPIPWSEAAGVPPFHPVPDQAARSRARPFLPAGPAGVGPATPAPLPPQLRQGLLPQLRHAFCPSCSLYEWREKKFTKDAMTGSERNISRTPEPGPSGPGRPDRMPGVADRSDRRPLP